LGIIKGLSVLGMKKPIVLRLKGTNMEEAQQILSDSGFNILCTDDLSLAAEKAVKITQIMRMAREANISVNLTS
jgi:succinyl-CoA synthetase beta subunit